MTQAGKPVRLGSIQLQAPGEVQAHTARDSYYQEYRHQDAIGIPYSLPTRFLSGIRPEADNLPEAPTICFINARSGGRDGPRLATALSRALSRVQVFDLSEHKPDKVLAQLWANFKAAIDAGEPNAALYQSRLRLLVAGGDGTIAWVLGCIKKLGLRPAPPVAILPLGTGNDLSRSFNWGPAFDYAWIKGYTGVYHTLLRVANAAVEDLDCWSLRMTLPSNEFERQLPHSLSIAGAATAATGTDYAVTVAPPAPVVATGLFWNYFSIGLDAKAAYDFHHLRETKPYLTRGRMSNQAWYSVFSCTSGWFCCAKPLSSRVKLEVQQQGSDSWHEVQLPPNIKALVLLNLQSYAGGRNLWGPHKPSSSSSTFKEPTYNDGMLEIVGLTSGYHTAAVMSTKGSLVHATRICQATGVRMQLRAKHVRADGTHSHAYMQIDGEPWVQDVPGGKHDSHVLVEISHAGLSKMLHNYQELENRKLPKSSTAAAALAKASRELSQGSGLQAGKPPSPSPNSPHLANTAASLSG